MNKKMITEIKNVGAKAERIKAMLGRINDILEPYPQEELDERGNKMEEEANNGENEFAGRHD